MKPKNKFQKQIFETSQTLPSITEVQVKWAYQNCFEHYGLRTKTGTVTCLECGASWKSEQTLIDSVCGCICPHCGMELKIKDTRKRIFKDYKYFCIITVCEGFQVLRFFYLDYCLKAHQKARYSHCEVLQKWIAPDGRNETVARLQSPSCYYNTWIFHTKLEIRPKTVCYYIGKPFIYTRQRLIPELERTGFNGNFYNLAPFDLFHTLLSDSRAETLLKAGEENLLHHFVNNGFDRINKYWASIKICIRNGYKINDASIWCDYINLLHFFGKDTHNAKYVCPEKLKAEHNKYVIKKQEWKERQRIEEAQKKALEDETLFKEMKSRFFDIQFSDGLIQVRVLNSVMEIMQEGKLLHHCVFANEYHLKPDTLILSACIGDKKIETVELSLSQLKVLQSRGLCNGSTEYHDRIIKLVENNVSLIKKRLAA